MLLSEIFMKMRLFMGIFRFLYFEAHVKLLACFFFKKRMKYKKKLFKK